jgi:hypothetical protein
MGTGVRDRGSGVQGAALAAEQQGENKGTRLFEPLAKLPSGYRLCQGTTSVVPQMANLDYGFSRCEIANC